MIAVLLNACCRLIASKNAIRDTASELFRGGRNTAVTIRICYITVLHLEVCIVLFTGDFSKELMALGRWSVFVC